MCVFSCRLSMRVQLDAHVGLRADQPGAVTVHRPGTGTADAARHPHRHHPGPQRWPLPEGGRHPPQGGPASRQKVSSLSDQTTVFAKVPNILTMEFL